MYHESMKNSTIVLTVGIVILVILGSAIGYFSYMRGLSQQAETTAAPTIAEEQNASMTKNGTSLANPASVNCEEKGGTLTIKKRPGGGEYGVCDFEDDMQCEEWALMRGECPVGGINTIGYDTEAEVYCAITGGKTLAVKDATCTLPDGTVCNAGEYFRGTCQ